MSVARHHAEWLSLTEVSGPFLSMPVLLRVFPQGLDAHDPECSRDVRSAFGEWEANQRGSKPDPAIHHAWIRYVLTRVLELPEEVMADGQAIPQGLAAVMTTEGETLRPDLAILNPTDMSEPGKPRLLIQVFPASQDLEKAVPNRSWKASPASRMIELLKAANVPLGLVTNGDRWMLVHALQQETAGFASWYASLWLEEPITLRAFASLLHARRFFGVDAPDTLDALYVESSQDQHEVTTQLGYQVRKAVEVLIQSLDRVDKDRGRDLLDGVDESTLYRSALTIMMRLVFLFSAEERGLLLLGDQRYDQFYAVSTLRAQLREAADQSGEEVLERRNDAWSRLLATFRAIYGGIQHEALRLPAYGGSLFDPDRFPFLEGRAAGTSWREDPAQPLPINNRTVLHLLEALQILQVKVPGGGPAEARRLSFRALDIEQIGHVYESLLDHTAIRSDETCLGLIGAKGKEPEIPLSKLIAKQTLGEAALLAFLKEETGRSDSALKKAVQQPNLLDDRGLMVTCDNDQDLFAAVRPYAALLRQDTLGYPVVITAGSVYVTEGTVRRSTGTHYTPRSLTEPIVQHTLDPLVYVDMAEGVPASPDTLGSPEKILSLKICDMACGSGAFLVQACRYLSEKLVESWGREEAAHPGAVLVLPHARLGTGDERETPLPADDEERLVLARRLVADRCLYGVDINPMAVEMAKLSLWLITLKRDQPFTFVDHAIRCGDSLLGVANLGQLLSWSLHPDAAPPDNFFTRHAKERFKSALDWRDYLENIDDADIARVAQKERLLALADGALVSLRRAADLIVGLAMAHLSKSEAMSKSALVQAWWTSFEGTHAQQEETDPEIAKFLPNRRTFHWPLEFPEVFEGHGGFDAIIGNPPFMGGKKITGALGTDYRNYLVEHLAEGEKGHADLCAYFFLQARRLTRTNGGFGLIATNTIAQGDTREVGLDQMTAKDVTLIRAVPSAKWPGAANLEVAHVWGRRSGWQAPCWLERDVVPGITAFLTSSEVVAGKPFRLKANEGKSFIGSYVLGMGFVMPPEEAQALIDKDPKNKDVLFPYLNGEDLNSRPDQSASRWVINFFDWPLNRSANGNWSIADEESQKKWLKSGCVPKDYPGPVAADYPDCLAIVEESVKTERAGRSAEVAAAPWWQFWRARSELYRAIEGANKVLVGAEVSKHISLGFSPKSNVFSHMIIVFVLDDVGDFGMLQSSIYDCWARIHGSSLETRFRHTPTDCFETLVLPAASVRLREVGAKYDALRTGLAQARQLGLTKTYNLFHDPECKDADIARLRDLHAEMDRAVAEAYCWDFELGHGFHQTKQGLRFTISEAARREVLGRLLKLNHERYAEEVALGLHDKGKKKAPKAKKGIEQGLLPFEALGLEIGR